MWAWLMWRVSLWNVHAADSTRDLVERFISDTVDVVRQHSGAPHPSLPVGHSQSHFDLFDANFPTVQRFRSMLRRLACPKGFKLSTATASMAWLQSTQNPRLFVHGDSDAESSFLNSSEAAGQVCLGNSTMNVKIKARCSERLSQQFNMNFYMESAYEWTVNMEKRLTFRRHACRSKLGQVRVEAAKNFRFRRVRGWNADFQNVKLAKNSNFNKKTSCRKVDNQKHE